jgi:hypothetical protein
MARYIKFNTSDGNPILVEVAESEVAPPGGVVKVGLMQSAQEAGIAAVSIAQNTFEQALEKILRPNAEAFVHSIRGISDPPTEIEITFALKVTGELGNVAICKAGAEANYTVKLGWKQASSEGSV